MLSFRLKKHASKNVADTTFKLSQELCKRNFIDLSEYKSDDIWIKSGKYLSFFGEEPLA